MTALETLHEAVDQLSEEEAALWLLALGGDPVALSLVLAPLDDEPETEEERMAVAEAYEDLAAGRVKTSAEVRHELLG